VDLAVAGASKCRPGNDGASSAPLTGPGPSVTAHYHLDLQEHRRRQDTGLRGVTDLSILDTLLSLPLDADIPVESITQRTLRITSRLPSGAVARTDRTIRRLVQAPLRVNQVTVQVRSGWSSPLHRVLEFSQLAERALLCATPPKDEQLLEASFHGVGVAVPDRGEWAWLVEPTPFVVRQHSAARWAFAEKVYEMHLARSAG